MELFFIILSSILRAVANATAFSAANLAFSMLTDHGAKERNRHDLAEEKLQRTRDKWNEYGMKRLDFINKRLREKMRQRHTSTMLMKEYLNTIAYLEKK